MLHSECASKLSMNDSVNGLVDLSHNIMTKEYFTGYMEKSQKTQELQILGQMLWCLLWMIGPSVA